MWMLLSAAWATEFFTEIEGPIYPQIGATWSFPLHREDGWYIATGQGGDLTLAPMDAQGQVDMSLVQTLTDVGDIKDHALRRCPDGSYLYVASTGIYDEVLIYGFDAQFTEVSFDTLLQEEPQIAGNDMAAICSDSFRGVGVAELNGLRDYFWSVDNAGMIDIPIELAQSPRMTGAGMWEFDEHLHVIGRDALPELSLAVYDKEFLLVDHLLVPPIADGIVHYWSSSLVQVEDHFLLLSMGRDPAAGFPLDTGNVYLAVLEQNLTLVSWTQLTHYTPQDGGGMRPWMAVHDDQLWVSYDRSNSVELISIQLNLEDFRIIEPSEEEDSGMVGEPESSPSEKEGGCAGGVIVPLLFLGLPRRKVNPCRT